MDLSGPATAYFALELFSSNLCFRRGEPLQTHSLGSIREFIQRVPGNANTTTSSGKWIPGGYWILFDEGRWLKDLTRMFSFSGGMFGGEARTASFWQRRHSAITNSFPSTQITFLGTFGCMCTRTSTFGVGSITFHPLLFVEDLLISVFLYHF